MLLQYSNISQRKGEGSMDHLEEILQASGLEIVGHISLGRVSRVLGMQARVLLFEIRRKLDMEADRD